MLTKLRIAVVLLLCLEQTALTQSVAVLGKTANSRYIEAKVLMPAGSPAQPSITGVTAGADFYATFLVVTNPTGSNDTFTIQDTDGATFAMYSACPIIAHQTYNIPLPTLGLKFHGGLFISSGSGSLVLRVQGGAR
jgi:hypothetical protein